MKVFLDFEASSLDKLSYPIEVGWAFENGNAESHLLKPLPHWTDWDECAQAIRGLARSTLLSEGESFDAVAARMIEVLTSHDLFASAPSWNRKWLSVLLRAGGKPRHALRLRDSEEAQRENAAQILAERVPRDLVGRVVERIVAQCDEELSKRPTAHRALPDAQAELAQWQRVESLARGEVEGMDRSPAGTDTAGRASG